MDYVINKTILFTTDIKQVSLLRDAECSIVLSNQAARLLEEMIRNNNKTLTREELLKKVWEDFGSTPSNNNLYMAVSEIRKAFRNSGLSEQIISTIPKVGFSFEAEIDLSQETIIKSNPLPHRIKKKINTRSGLKIIIGVLVIIVVANFFMYHRMDPTIINKKFLDHSFKFEKCLFFPLGMEDEIEKKEIIEFIGTDFVQKTIGTNCFNSESVVYYKYLPSPLNEVHVTNCQTAASTELKNCATMRVENDQTK